MTAAVIGKDLGGGALHGAASVPWAAMSISPAPALLARGPWAAEQIAVRWREAPFEPSAAENEAADAAIAALRDRGSPSHDGVAARLVEWSADDGRLDVVLQPLRWALRLVEHNACDSVSAVCVTRDADGRWLAGRRASWLSSWAGRWALGAGGAVDAGESPFETLTRELREEWSVTPERVVGEALIRLPNGLIMFVGQAWLAPGAEVASDEEHDAHAWWPADVDAWPAEADDPLKAMARLLS